MITQVVKNNGVKEDFDKEKIVESIWKSALEVGGKDRSLAKKLAEEVVRLLVIPAKAGIQTSTIGELVEKVLIERGHAKTAKAYILYRENKKHSKQDKDSLGVVDDIGLSYNTLYILKERFLRRDETGKVIETPREMMVRVARYLASVEKGKTNQSKWFEKFYEILSNFEFVPGGRTMANAGEKSAQLSNCFVWPIEDDINHIFEILHKSTVIKKHGGGCGYNFSRIRSEGDMVAGTPGLAAGPVKMMEMFDLMTGLFKQRGKYESGNMVILNVNHPDIFNFITAKKNDGYLSKTNISIGITDEFMEAALGRKDWLLISPKTGEVVNRVDAKAVLELVAQMAWATGDPGIINLSAINKGTAHANPLLKKRGMIMATNVCGEVPLYPYESCNLGSVNFAKLVKNSQFDFDRLTEVMKVAVRFMDNVVDIAWFPVKEVGESVRNHRRVGIGCVGWAEALIALGISYDSEEARKLSEKVVKTMYETAFATSVKIAKEKGPFPLVGDSIWANLKDKPRNVALLTFPPTSNGAVICETSYGIEPLFALAYEQNVMDGVRLKSVNQLFLKDLKKRGLYSEELIQKVIDNHGSVQGIREIPKDMQAVYKIAHDIDWRDHIKMQASFQKWTDNAITKTINLPGSATPQDIEEAYVMAWKLGCKGITVYRDQSKEHQVFEFGAKEKTADRYCPNCDIKLTRDSKCFKCKKCGFSTCEL